MGGGLTGARRPLIMGVDPGLSGAIAFYNFEERSLSSVYDIPTKRKANGRNEIDAFALAQICDRYYARVELAVIEEVHSMPGDGKVQAFSFGYAAGLVAGAISAFNIPVVFVQPGVWKILSGLNTSKDLSRATAGKAFPTHTPLFKRKKDDGRAEAALLAKFGERFVVNAAARRAP